jgi:predicted amino acid-binding ACT domain protein
MTATIRGVEYFYVMVKDRPGEAYQLLTRLAAAHVNLLAFSAIPTGPEHTQLVLFPEKVETLVKAAAAGGFLLAGPERAFLIQGDDRLGAIADIHRKLFDAHINVYASSGVTDGRGSYGYVLYVKADQYRSAALVLGA